MPPQCLRRVFSLAIAMMLFLGGCNQSAIWSIPASPTAVMGDEADVAALVDQLSDEYGLAQDDYPLVSVQPVLAGGEETLFVAHTHGFPADDPSFRQKVSIHAMEADGWKTLGRVDLECAEYLNAFSVAQANIDPAVLWLTVLGGVGAHGGCLELLRWDGEELAVMISGFSSSPDAGALLDLNGDGREELRLNNSDPYIFCYACGVRQYWAQLFYWDGERLMEVTPARLGEDQAPDLRAFNDRAAELAAASLFADALEEIEKAEALEPENATVAWNAIWIRHHLEASRKEASTSSYPLVNHVFAGDWETAFDTLWEVGLPTFASDAPIPSESAAFGFEHVVGLLLAQFADTALTLQPERAAVHALGAWGRFLIDPNDPAVQPGLERAAQLSSADSRFQAMADAFEDRSVIVAVDAAAAGLPSEEALRDLLAIEFGSAEDPARNVGVKKLRTEDGSSLFAAFTHGLPPLSPRELHMVSIHEASPSGWVELDRVELECVSYLDEYSLEQELIEPTSIWLTVRGGAGAHGGCLELLRWDGQALSLVISSFNSIPDAGAVRDLNGDGQLDLLLNNSDPYIFCYACGLQLYLARFFHWDGQKFAEAAPRDLAEEHAIELRAANSLALALAESGLYAEAAAEIEQARMMAPSNRTVQWNALWIGHHLEVSRQLALASPFPLLSHVFAGDWDASFDELWSMGPPSSFGDTPIPIGSAAFGFEQTVGHLLVQYGNSALGLQPGRADIHALTAWGRFLLNQDDPAVLAALMKAADLAPEDTRFAELAAFFADRAGEEN